MRVLYFSRAYTPHDHRFLTAIAEAGHQPFFLKLITNQASDKRALPEGTEELHWTGSLRKLVADIKPDLIHAGSLDTCSYLAAKRDFHPLVQMSWGSDILHYAKRNPFIRARVTYALKKGDALICDCETVQRSAEQLGFPADRIVSFPWGVDLKRFSPTGADAGLRKKLGWQSMFVLLHLRSWEDLYDPETVVRGFLRAAASEPRLRLLMPGAGSLEPRVKTIVARSGLQDRVHFAGHISQDELPAYYRAADLYLSGSLSDGSSVSLMEGLASGLPALVSDIPSNREWIHSGKEGWLFKAGNEKDLADKILSAMNNKKLKTISAQARKTAQDRANWTRNKKGLDAAYKLALQHMSGTP
jgi:glycosyltransferase involved in cell wall biosynthesis